MHLPIYICRYISADIFLYWQIFLSIGRYRVYLPIQGPSADSRLISTIGTEFIGISIYRYRQIFLADIYIICTLGLDIPSWRWDFCNGVPTANFTQVGCLMQLAHLIVVSLILRPWKNFGLQECVNNILIVVLRLKLQWSVYFFKDCQLGNESFTI